jgi:hypothetical protein
VTPVNIERNAVAHGWKRYIDFEFNREHGTVFVDFDVRLPCLRAVQSRSPCLENDRPSGFARVAYVAHEFPASPCRIVPLLEHRRNLWWQCLARRHARHAHRGRLNFGRRILHDRLSAAEPARALRAVWCPCTQMKHQERTSRAPIADKFGEARKSRDGRESLCQQRIELSSSGSSNAAVPSGHASLRVNVGLDFTPAPLARHNPKICGLPTCRRQSMAGSYCRRSALTASEHRHSSLLADSHSHAGADHARNSQPVASYAAEHGADDCRCIAQCCGLVAGCSRRYE